MFCKNCNKYVPATDKCPICGSAFEENAAEDTYGATNQEVYEEAPMMRFDTPKEFFKTMRGKGFLQIFSSITLWSALFLYMVAIIVAIVFIIKPNLLVAIVSLGIAYFAAECGAPAFILAIFIERRNARWLRSNSVDFTYLIDKCKENKKMRNQIPVIYSYVYLRDNPSGLGFWIVTSIISWIQYPLVLMSGAAIIMAPRLGYFLPIPVLAIVIPFVVLVICTIPVTIIAKIKESKSKKHYEENYLA